MIFYKIDYAIGKIFTTEPRQERMLIRKYTGTKLSEREAIRLWDLIVDHKWYLSETLGRDVGIHMAAVDYVENFHTPAPVVTWDAKVSAAWERFVKPAIREYFEAKGAAITY
jgi:Domain of unknown function (DUF4032)